MDSSDSTTPETPLVKSEGVAEIQAVKDAAHGTVEQLMSFATDDATRGDLSAITIARMMGLATVSEVKLLESKMELLLTKLSAVLLKVEKVSSSINNVPTGADLERIDVQIGSLRQMIREVLSSVPSVQGANEKDAGKKPGSKIVSNSPKEPVDEGA